MIQPLRDYILVQREPAPAKSSSIIIPDIAKEKSIIGTVLAVGPGKMVEGVNGNLVRRPLDVQIGDRVHFNSKWNETGSGDGHYSTDSETEGERLHLVQEADVFLVIR